MDLNNEISIYATFIVFIIGLIIWIVPKKDKTKNWNYRKIQRKEENKKAAEKYKNRVQPYKGYDPEMFSNEPLDFEKAKNMKYRAYTQAQWDELKK